MCYGIVLESIRQGICKEYGIDIWNQIHEQINNNPHEESFQIFNQYSEQFIEQICQCLQRILLKGTLNEYMFCFGQYFIQFLCQSSSYRKYLQISGKNYTHFLYSINQIHYSLQSTFPQMKFPFFTFFKDNSFKTIYLKYKCSRQGFDQYLLGQLYQCAQFFPNEQISIKIATNQYENVLYEIQWKHFRLEKICQRNAKRLNFYPPIANGTFFQIFPYSIILNSELIITHLGQSMKNLFPLNQQLIGKPFEEIFLLIEPNLSLLQWNHFIDCSEENFFLIENQIPLRSRRYSKEEKQRIRFKGQMKYLCQINHLVLLSYPILTTIEQMINIGITFHDLTLFNRTSEILFQNIQHPKHLQTTIDQHQSWRYQLEKSQLELEQWKKQGKNLLYSLMPHHIAQMLEHGFLPNSICESHQLITVLFCYLLDFKDLIYQCSPFEIVQSINQMISLFDQAINKYHVFKVESKADSSYMIVSGMEQIDQKQQFTNRSINEIVEKKNDLMIIENEYKLNQCEIISELAIDLLNQSNQLINEITGKAFQIQIGFHSGPAVGAIVGQKTYQYCLFGDTINTASRMTTTSEINEIHLSERSNQLLKYSKYFQTIPRGNIFIKGKGNMQTYWLIKKIKSSIIN